MGMWKGCLRMTILEFPTKKSNLQKITISFEVEILEDGSMWWRIEDIKTGEYGEWVKLEGEE